MSTSNNYTSGAATMSPAIGLADNYNQWVLHNFHSYLGKKLLEVGSGQGNFFKFVPNEVEFFSIDVDEALVQEAKQKYPLGNYQCLNMYSPDFLKLCHKHNIDSVLCVNVLEHLEDDAQALRQMVEAVAPRNGRVFLYVPAHNFLYNHLDQKAGHFRRYSKSHLENLLRGIPLVKRSIIFYQNPVGAIGWWFNKFSRKQDLHSKSVERQILFFDKYLVPISRFLSFFTHRFFGQSLVAIIETGTNTK